MKGLRVGLFSDNGRRDHSYTIAGLKAALQRSELVTECFDVTPSGKVGHEALRTALQSPFLSFDGIALDTEFAEVPGFAPMLFALDNALALNARQWTEAEIDSAATLSRIVAFDIRPWAFYRSIFSREIPLLPAPLPSYEGFAFSSKPRVVVVVNDISLWTHSQGSVRTAIHSASPDVEITEIMNGYAEPAAQSAWMNPALSNASAHIHIGHPPEAVSAGRLIDSMNMRSPCVVFDDTNTQRDSGISIPWKKPAFINDINIVRTSSIAALSGSVRVILQDRAWSQNLIRNALREVEDFQKQFHTAFLKPFTGELVSWRQS